MYGKILTNIKSKYMHCKCLLIQIKVQNKNMFTLYVASTFYKLLTYLTCTQMASGNIPETHTTEESLARTEGKKVAVFHCSFTSVQSKCNGTAQYKQVCIIGRHVHSVRTEPSNMPLTVNLWRRARGSHDSITTAHGRNRSCRNVKNAKCPWLHAPTCHQAQKLSLIVCCGIPGIPVPLSRPLAQWHGDDNKRVTFELQTASNGRTFVRVPSSHGHDYESDYVF
jgi:hypothetical protein